MPLGIHTQLRGLFDGETRPLEITDIAKFGLGSEVNLVAVADIWFDQNICITLAQMIKTLVLVFFLAEIPSLFIKCIMVADTIV